MAVIFVRTIVIFLVLMLLMRIMGKRQLGELQISELVVSVLTADLAAIPMQDVGIPLINGIVPIVVLFACELIISDFGLRSVRFRAIVCGKPCVLIKDGKILQRHMRRCRFTIDDLSEELRSKSITDVSRVQFAVLETDGTLSTILYPAEAPLTASLMGVEVQPLGFPYTIIDSGRVLSNNLTLSGHNASWLQKQLDAHGVRSAKEVYALIVFESGKVYFEKMEGAK